MSLPTHHWLANFAWLVLHQFIFSHQRFLTPCLCSASFSGCDLGASVGRLGCILAYFVHAYNFLHSTNTYAVSCASIRTIKMNIMLFKGKVITPNIH